MNDSVSPFVESENPVVFTNYERYGVPIDFVLDGKKFKGRYRCIAREDEVHIEPIGWRRKQIRISKSNVFVRGTGPGEYEDYEEIPPKRRIVQGVFLGGIPDAGVALEFNASVNEVCAYPEDSDQLKKLFPDIYEKFNSNPHAKLCNSWNIDQCLQSLSLEWKSLPANLASLSPENESSISGMNVVLRDYQIESLHFMLDRENVADSVYSSFFAPVNERRHVFPPVYKPVAELLPEDKRGLFSFSPTLEMHCLTSTLKDCPRGGWLCDSMGMGKTVTILALTERQRRSTEFANWVAENHGQVREMDGRRVMKCTLIICPVSLLGQWEKEIRSQCSEGKNLKIVLYYGPKCKKESFWNEETYNCDYMITTYTTVAQYIDPRVSEHIPPWEIRDSSWPGYSANLDRFHFNRIIFDESHTLSRSTNTQTYIMCSNLSARNIWFVSGTPFEKSLVTSLCKVTEDFFFKPSCMDGSFHLAYRDIQKKMATHLLSKFLIRHRAQSSYGDRNEALPLPPKQETIVPVPFTEPQMKLYLEQRDFAVERFKLIQVQPNPRSFLLRAQQLLFPLRQMSSYDSLVPSAVREAIAAAKRVPFEKRSGASQILSPHEEMKSFSLGRSGSRDGAVASRAFVEEDHQCPLCLAEFDNPIITPCGHVFCYADFVAWIQSKPQNGDTVSCPACRVPVHGKNVLKIDLPTYFRDLKKKNSSSSMNNSAEKEESEIEEQDEKSQMSSEDVDLIAFDHKIRFILEELKSGVAQKAVIFSRFSKSNHAMFLKLKQEGMKPVSIIAAANGKKRFQAAQTFQSDPTCRAIILSLGSSASGLNLTSADALYLMEPGLNKHEELQAIARIFRMTQEKSVQIKRLVTCDRKSFEKKREKRRLGDGRTDLVYVELNMARLAATFYSTQEKSSGDGEENKEEDTEPEDMFRTNKRRKKSKFGSLKTGKLALGLDEVAMLLGLKQLANEVPLLSGIDSSSQSISSSSFSNS